MTDWRETALCCLLDCGTADLSLLDNVDVDIYDALEECREEYGDTNINNVVRTIFSCGITAIETELEERIDELDGCEDSADREELEALMKCKPWEDIRSYHNYLDTHVWVENHGELYRKYLPHAIEAFEQITGFSITID